MKIEFPIILVLALVAGTVAADATTDTARAVAYLIDRDPHPKRGDAEWAAEIAAAIEAAADESHIDPALLTAMAWRESRFRPDILSGKKRGSRGEVGLLQVGPQGRAACSTFMDSVEGQARCGAQWLRKAIDDCGGDVRAGLHAYACGRCDPEQGHRARWAVGTRLRLAKRLTGTFYNN